MSFYRKRKCFSFFSLSEKEFLTRDLRVADQLEENSCGTTDHSRTDTCSRVVKGVSRLSLSRSSSSVKLPRISVIFYTICALLLPSFFLEIEH
jgi:hypothetical protein